VVDIATTRAWRDGKEVRYMRNRGDNGRKKKLSPKGLKLVAAYLRKPNAPLCPYNSGPYHGNATESCGSQSAQAMLLKMIQTLRLKDWLCFQSNPSDTPGEGLYAFNPNCKYMLIVPDEET
jgi:hypothetical protein